MPETAPTSGTPGSKTALVIGCGGTIGGAWAVAALDELARQTGWDPADASVLQGASAGAEMVTMLGGGFTPSDSPTCTPVAPPARSWNAICGTPRRACRASPACTR